MWWLCAKVKVEIGGYDILVYNIYRVCFCHTVIPVYTTSRVSIGAGYAWPGNAVENPGMYIYIYYIACE